MNTSMNQFRGDLRYPDGTALQPGALTIYTHVSDMGAVRHWHIDKMMRLTNEAFKSAVNGAETTGIDFLMVPIEDHMIPILTENRGVEQHRLDRLTRVDLSYPVIFVEISGEGVEDPPVSHLLVDGNHRYVWAAMNGISEIRGVIFSEEMAHSCRVIGLPDLTRETVLTMESGIA